MERMRDHTSTPEHPEAVRQEELTNDPSWPYQPPCTQPSTFVLAVCHDPWLIFVTLTSFPKHRLLCVRTTSYFQCEIALGHTQPLNCGRPSYAGHDSRSVRLTFRILRRGQLTGMTRHMTSRCANQLRTGLLRHDPQFIRRSRTSN